MGRRRSFERKICQVYTTKAWDKPGTSTILLLRRWRILRRPFPSFPSPLRWAESSARLNDDRFAPPVDENYEDQWLTDGCQLYCKQAKLGNRSVCATVRGRVLCACFVSGVCSFVLLTISGVKKLALALWAFSVSGATFVSGDLIVEAASGEGEESRGVNLTFGSLYSSHL